MPRSRSLSLSVLVLAAAACRPQSAAAPPGPLDFPALSDEELAAGGVEAADRARHADLGAREQERQPLVKVEPETVSAGLPGAAFLYGARGPTSGRPSAPGRRGDLLLAIDTPYQIFGRSATYAHVAAWRPDGKPAANARVFVNRTAVGKTDATGSLVFKFHQRKKDRDDEDDFSLGGDSVFVIDGSKRCGAVGFDPYERTQTFATDRLFVYTDRGVYQPGDTVHVRSLGWRLRHDYKPLTDAKIEFLLRDDGGHSIAAAVGTTDAFGITAVDLDVPLTAESGDYRLRVAYGDERASTKLQVRHFELPTLGVEHTLGRFLVVGGPGPLAFDVTLKPPAGGPVSSAEIRASARGEKGDVVAVLARDVKGAGPHRFTFSAKDVAKMIEATTLGRSASVRIQVTDDQGREAKVVRGLEVTHNPFTAILENDRDAYSTGDPVSIVARIADLDSVPLRNEMVELSVSGIPKPLRAKTDAAGMAKFSFAMPPKQALVELKRPGQKTPLATSEVSWMKRAPMRTEIGSATVKERQKTRVTVRFPAGYRPVESRVHMDITDTSGAIVGSKLLRVRTDHGRPVATGEFTAPSWGSMLLTFFALGERTSGVTTRRKLGLLVAGQNLVVQTDRELDVTLEGMPARARPGQRLDIRARVRDHAGKPAEVSVGAALINKNVLRMKDPLEITPMDRFYDPTLRTLATTGAKMLTWPVVTRNWGSRAHDVALPPFPWLGSGDVVNCRHHWDERDYKAAGESIGLGGYGLIGKGGGGGTGAGYGRGKTRITIRKRFPVTSIWEPHLHGKGEVAIVGQLPDSIGEQELIVVASDKKGGVGMARQTLTIDQKFFVEAVLPDTIVAGETMTIPALMHNRTAETFDAVVTALRDGTAATAGTASVPARGQAAVPLTLSFNGAGAAKLELRAAPSGTLPADILVRDVRVRPAGVAVLAQHGVVVGKGSATLEFEVPAGAAADAHVRVEFPAVTSGFIGLDGLLDSVNDEPRTLAGDLTTAVLVLELADRHKIRSSEVTRLREGVLAVLTILGRIQRSDGGFGYWRNGKPSPYITAKLLEGMLEARRTGLPVSDETIGSAANFLAFRVRAGIPVDNSAIGWWEGESSQIREGITAEIFDVLARTPKRLRSPLVKDQLKKLTKRYKRYLDSASIDPLTGARALSGLIRRSAIEPDEASEVAGRLVSLRDRGHWEPTWFHAYAGRVDATLAVLEALELVDPAGHQIEKRDALSWILATRPAWGDWHNDVGTAAALRALALVGAPPEASAATLVVAVDGTQVHKLKVDPADPLGSTLSAHHIDLGRLLPPGKHRVTVSYDGTLEPSATLVTRTWTRGKSGQHKSRHGRLVVDGPKQTKVGDPLLIRVRAQGKRLGGSTILVSSSGLIDADLGALGRTIGRGRPISAVARTADGLALTVAPGAGRVAIDLPYVAARAGEGRLPGVALIHSRSTPLIVDPGPLEVTR